MNETWDELWSRLEPELRNLGDRVSGIGSNLRSQIGRTKAANFPFGAYLTFTERDSGEEELVVSVDCKTTRDGLRLSCDIAKANGRIIVEGPAATLPYEGSAESVLNWAEEVVGFIRASEGIVAGELGS